MNIDGLVSIKFNSPFRTVPGVILPRDLWLLCHDGGGLTGIGDKLSNSTQILSLGKAVNRSLKNRVFSTYTGHCKNCRAVQCTGTLHTFIIIVKII